MSDKKNIHAAVVIPAAGSGLRMATPLPKQFIAIGDAPVLIHTVRCFLATDTFHPVIVALAADHLETARQMFANFFLKKQLSKLILIVGGETRQESVLAGIRHLPPETDFVLVHDGARPFVSHVIIDRCLTEAAASGAAIAAVPVRDTIKQIGRKQKIVKTVDRQNLWQAQTPQVFRRELLEKSYELAEQHQFQGTDEASLLEHAGFPVSVVLGSEHNIKITRHDDLKIATGLLGENRKMKIGHGFDAHRFAPERLLILGGVTIPFALGLEGHSDADVLTHALIDSLLGAMGKGDIGSHFPDRDPQFKNISSLKLLGLVIDRLQADNFFIANTDITVICQQPRLTSYIAAMKNNIAAVCNLEAKSVNIKATTTEMMGYTGRGEGIAAHAVVLLQQK